MTYGDVWSIAGNCNDVTVHRAHRAQFPRVLALAMALSVVLASFVAQVRGVMFYEFQMCGAALGDRVVLVRRPDDRHDANCLEVRLAGGHHSYMLGHVAAEVAAHLSPLLCDQSLQASG